MKKEKMLLILAILLIFSKFGFGQLVVKEVVYDNPCYGSSIGVISLMPEVILGNIHVKWDTGDTTLLIHSLPKGFYKYAIVDDFYPNDTVRGTVEIKQPNKLSFSVKYLENPLCYSSSDGSAQIVVSGGTGQSYGLIVPIPIGINNLSYNEFTLSNLTSGYNKFLIKDEIGCVSYDSIRLGNRFPGPLNAEVKVVDASCDDCNDGSIRLVAVENGNHPYRLYLDQFVPEIDAFSKGITGLKPGTYSFEIKAGDPYCILWMTVDIGSKHFIDTASNELVPIGFITGDALKLGTLDGIGIEIIDPDFQMEVYRIYKNGSVAKVYDNKSSAYPWDKKFQGQPVVGPCLVTCSYQSNQKKHYLRKVVQLLESN